jgi:Transposase DDE domain
MPAKNTEDDLSKELEYCKTLERHIETDVSLSSSVAIKEKLNLLKETLQDTQGHYILSTDTDARIGHKSADSSFFGYKTHIAMTQERIITAAVVTSGEKGDGPQLPTLLEISQNNGLQVDTIIGDTAYSGKENLALAKQQDIQVVAKLLPSISQGFRKNEDAFEYNKDADMFVCPGGICPSEKQSKARRM